MAGDSTRTITVKFAADAKGVVAGSKAADDAIGRVGKNTKGMKTAESEADKLGKKLDQTAKDAEKSGSLLGGALAVGLTAAAPLVAGALVGGVSFGLIGVAALVQKNNAAVKGSYEDLRDQVVGEMTDVTNQVAPALAGSLHQLQQEFTNLGPQLKTAFSYAGPDIKILTDGVDTLADNAMPGLVTSMTKSKPIVLGIATVLGDLGSTTTSVLDAVSDHSQEFGVDLDRVGSLIKDLGGTVAGVLPGMASGFGSTVGTADDLFKALVPIAPAIGQVTGSVLPAVGAFKLFGLATAPLVNTGKKISGVATSLGTYTLGATKSATVGQAVATSAEKVGSALGKVGNALPLVGVGFALASVGAEKLFGDQDQLANALQTQTGSALQATQTKLASNDATTIALHNSLGGLGDFLASTFVPTTADAESGLSDAQKAQIGYNEAVANFGAGSSQAAAAQHTLSTAVAAATTQQELENKAMETSSQRLADHVNDLLNAASAQLSLESATNSVTDAQTAYQAAVKKSGKNSEDAKEASISLQQAIVSEIQTAGQKAATDDAAGTAAERTAAATRAQTATVFGLIESYSKSGQAIPPVLSRLAGGLDGTRAAAAVATGEIEHVTGALSKLPPGKSVKVAALTSEAITDLTNMGYRVTHLPNGTFKVTAIDEVSSKVNDIVRLNNGKTIRVNVVTGNVATGPYVRQNANGNLLQFNAGGRLNGLTPMSGSLATVVPPNTWRVIGDNPSVPELFAPLNGSTRTAGLIGEAAAHEGVSTGNTVINGDTFDLVFAGEVLASIVDGRIQSHNRLLKSRVRAGVKR